ncbi:MAG: SLBB domain-containing protein, partial [Candidatus Eremiobacteraeota bacterium]|nr:SLBB domain-containing protein [Candidatus Eremiobacteraeota bacterium]
MARVVLVLGIVLVAAILLRHPAAPIVAQNASIEGARPKIRSQQSASPTILVYVSGSVARPGLFRMNASSRVNEAVSRAGGMLPGADAAGVNLAAV